MSGSRYIHATPVADSVPYDNTGCDLVSETVQDAIDELCAADVDATGKLLDFIFVATGNTADKWLGVGNGSTNSDTLPYVVHQECELIALTFSNQDDNVDIDIEVYRNGVLDFTWEVRNKRTAWNTDFSNGTYSQGDRMSLFVRKYTGGTGDQTAQDPIIEILLRVTGTNTAEGGTQYGV